MVQIQTGGSVDGETELAIMDTHPSPSHTTGNLKGVTEVTLHTRPARTWLGQYLSGSCLSENVSCGSPGQSSPPAF